MVRSIPDLVEAIRREPGCRVPLVPRRKFLYLFDFGDEWWHEVTVERVDAPLDAAKYPCILERCGNSPSQYPVDEDDE